MKRSVGYFFIFAVLLPCCLLTGCSPKIQHSGAASASKQTANVLSEEEEAADPSEILSFSEVTQERASFEPETSGDMDFRYIYRGFTAVSRKDDTVLERFLEFDEQIITTEEAWSAFMDAYCPGIPYGETWDFSEDYLIVFIADPASPAYASSNTIIKLSREDGHFIPAYENDPDHYIYAFNSEEYAHFYVEVIAVKKEQHSPVQKETVSEPTGGDFKTVCRCFEIVSLDDREAFERFSGFGTKVITTEADWNGFTDIFFPDIPEYEAVDFAENSLIVSVMMGARPTYAAANQIVAMDPEYGCPVFEDSAANCVYALNTENHTHFYIAVIALPREQIANTLEVWTN